MKPSIFFLESIDEIKEQLEAGAKLEARLQGSTPLFFVDNPEIAEFLISKGAKIEAKAIGACIGGARPLFAMAIRGNIDVAKVLLKHGADINAKDNTGSTALFYAKTAEMAEFLLENGADINVKDQYGNTPLHSDEMEIPAAEVLIKHGLDANIKNNSGKTPLDVADTKEMREFLESYIAKKNK